MYQSIGSGGTGNSKKEGVTSPTAEQLEEATKRACNTIPIPGHPTAIWQDTR